MKKKKKVRKQNNRGVIDLPMDLKVEILKKLPAKSLMRFQCVSKQWSSIISSRPDFIESIVARPLPRDTKLIVHHRLQHPNSIFIFTSTNSENKDNESVVSSNALFYQHVRGLICFNSYDGVAIYNPTTRQYLPLPKCPRRSTSSCLFGYDPLENRYKVVCPPRCKEEPCQVFTLGNPIEKQYWRKIKGIGPHYPIHLMVCVNGTIYYQAKTPSYSKAYFLVSFDVRSEIFGLVENPNPLKGPRCSTLIKYHGKLGLMSCQNGLEIWVMDNGGKKQEWSKIIFYQLEGLIKNWSIRGVTHGGEIVFVDMVLRPNGQLFVYYYDAEQNSLKRVEVKGIEHRPELVYNVRPVPDHVENTMRL